MGIKKAMIRPGNRFKRVSYGDIVTVKYSGHVFDIQRPQHGFRGKQFQSRNDPEFTTLVKENLVVEGEEHPR